MKTRSSKTFSVVLVEDEPDVQARLADLIRADERFVLMHVADGVESGRRALVEHQPDILLTDLGLIDGSGVDIIRAIATVSPTTQAIVLSGFQDETHVFSALQAGATGYILKQDSHADIMQSLDVMLNGGAPISPAIARMMLQAFQPSTEKAELADPLTDRQINILRYVSQGYSSKEIATSLHISYYTVTTHIKNIYTSLQVNNRTEAVHQARKLGYLSS